MKKALAIALFVIWMASVLLVACASVVLGAQPSVEDEIIVMRACKELGLRPSKTALVLLSQEDAPWLEWDVFKYALIADDNVYLVDVQKLGEKVHMVDVIEQVDSIEEARRLCEKE